MPDVYELMICDISGEHKPVAVFQSERPFMPLHVGERFDDHGWYRLDGVGKIGSPEKPVRYLVFATKHVVFKQDGKTIYQFRNVSTTLRQRLLDFKLDFLRLALVD